jgi:hypothetical protein
MARYWVYVNNEVAGPFPLEQLIRQRSFSRHTQVCIDDASGQPGVWINAAQIPELARVFKTVDERESAPTPLPAPKPAPKREPVRPALRPAPVATSVSPPKSRAVWPWLLGAVLMAGGLGGYRFYQRQSEQERRSGAESAKGLVLNAALPATSRYATIDDYLSDNAIRPGWDVERAGEGVYHLSARWQAPGAGGEAQPSRVCAFSVNLPAQTVHGLNSAGTKLLAEGFPRPAAAERKAPPKPKSPAEAFQPALDARRSAVESGDFPTIWKSFSRRKRAEMAKGGISQEGFVRLQALTYRLESPPEQQVLKTKSESEHERLVLMKQTQAKRDDVFLKQQWVFEDDEWRLDEEEKRIASTPAEPAEPAAKAPAPTSAPPSAPSTAPEPAQSESDNAPRPRPSKEAILSLPGLSH